MTRATSCALFLLFSAALAGFALGLGAWMLHGVWGFAFLGLGGVLVLGQLVSAAGVFWGRDDDLA